MVPDSRIPDVTRESEQEMYQLSATDWALRAGVALVFSIFALEKLFGSSWVSLFAAIGLGQWFRYFTGAVQLAGSALLLIPRTARLGAGLIASTMVGAMVFHLTVLDTGVGGAIIPAVLLPLIIAAGWKGRGQPAETAGLVLR
jgi:putative oxidoreductase